MEPLHAIEYELTSELAADVQRNMLRHAARHAWRRELPLLLGWLVFAGLLAWPVVGGWWSPGIGGAVLFLVTLVVLCTVYRRRWQDYAAVMTAVAGFHMANRRVRLEFHEKRLLMETEMFRGEGAWSELDEVIAFANSWALRFSNGGQVVIPAALVTPELKSFLEARAAENETMICEG